MSDKEFDWKRFQRHLDYSDEELENFRGDPRKARAAPKLFSREVTKKFLVFEVVKSHGCAARMKVGDRLFFRGFAILDLKRSNPTWCAHALAAIPSIANMALDRYIAGLDPDDMVYNHIPCLDVGAEHGWGQVIMKAYVQDESEVND